MKLNACLFLPKAGVVAAAQEQFSVGSFFGDASLVENDDPVHPRCRGQPMSDGKHGLSPHPVGHATKNRLLKFSVERTGGLVEQQNRSISEHNAGDGYPLSLTA